MNRNYDLSIKELSSNLQRSTLELFDVLGISIWNERGSFKSVSELLEDIRRHFRTKSGDASMTLMLSYCYEELANIFNEYEGHTPLTAEVLFTESKKVCTLDELLGSFKIIPDKEVVL